MRIIVTGGCGFIGSHLVDELVNLKHQVIVIDNLSASENEKFYFNEKASYYHLDICDKDKIENLFFQTEYVFHLAAESRIQPAIKNPKHAYSVNVIGTLNILELSKKYNIKRVILSSTSSVYGLTEKLPTTEEDAIFCLNPYSHSKFLAENLAQHYTKIYDLDTIILRYFNVYGERSPIKGQYAPVVGIFLNQKKNGLPLTIVSDGSRRRDFVHVLDVVQSNILCMDLQKKLDNRIFNVGSGINHSIKEIADSISDNQINLPDREGEAENTLSDISLIQKTFGFRNNFGIKEWIKNKVEEC